MAIVKEIMGMPWLDMLVTLCIFVYFIGIFVIGFVFKEYVKFEAVTKLRRDN